MSEVLRGRTEREVLGKDGEIHTLETRRFAELPDDGELNLLSQAAPTIIRPSRARPRVRKDKLLADIPDIQFGYRRINGGLAPLHDPEAMDVALQVIKDQQPDQIILGGDELDLAELSKYPPDSAHFVDTLQASIDGLHKFLAQLRADNPNARIRNLSSNHIKRLGDFVMKNAMPLFGIRRANMPDDFPAMSYAHLLRLDELDIEYEGGYSPSSSVQINDRLETIHGDKSNSRGSTAAMYLSYREKSLMFHHTHRAEDLIRTWPSGKQTRAFSFGSLCSNEGEVPSHGSAVTDKGEVVTHRQNWQTGAGFVEYQDGDKPFRPHFVSIDPQEGHEAVFDGKEYKPNE